MVQCTDDMGLVAQMAESALQPKEDRAVKIEKHAPILDWLSPINPGVVHRRVSSLRQHGTGQWLLKDS